MPLVAVSLVAVSLVAVAINTTRCRSPGSNAVGTDTRSRNTASALRSTSVHLLLLSGRPGAGKTEYSVQLARLGFAAIETDKHPEWLERLQVSTLEQAVSVRNQARSLGENVVMEWGYFPVLLPSVRLLRAAGFDAWWLDGDPVALVESYRRRWKVPDPMQSGQPYRLQKDRIDGAWPELERFYGPSHILWTVYAGPNYMTFDNFCSSVLKGVNRVPGEGTEGRSIP